MGNSNTQGTVRQWTDEAIRTRKRTHQIREIRVRDADPEVIRQVLEALQGPPKPRPQEAEWVGWWQDEKVDSRKQVALIGWGLRHDLGESSDPAVSSVMEMLEKKGYGIQIANGNLQAWSPTDREVRGDIAKQLKGRGVTTAIFFVARSNQALQLAWGDCSIAGIELWLVPIEGFNSTPMPCTMRYKGTTETGLHALEAGRWVEHQVAGVTAYRWKEPRWSFEELANTVFPMGNVIMWKPEDYQELETPIASRWLSVVALAQKRKREILEEARTAPRTALADLQKDYYAACNREAWYADQQGEPIYARLQPPDYVWEKVDEDEWVPAPMRYPHTLPLTGFRFCEVPLRYIDYLVGEPWIYGEFAMRLRQYHAHPIIQAELARFTPTTLTLGGKGVPDDKRNLDSTSSGYWKGNEFVSTGCIKGPSLKEVPVWLIAHDPSGRELRVAGGKPVKASYNETPRETYLKSLERRGFADVECIRPDSWIFGTPWAFDNYKEEDEDGDGEIEDKNLQDECRILEEEGDFARRPEMQRFPYNKVATRWDPQPEEKNHRNAWYTALEISEQLAHLQERAKAAQTPEDWNGEHGGIAKTEPLSERLLGIDRDLDAVIREANITCWTDPHLLQLMADYYRLQEVMGLCLQDSQERTPAQKQSLLEEFRSITLQVTPLLIKMLGERQKGKKVVRSYLKKFDRFSSRIEYRRADADGFNVEVHPQAQASMLEKLREQAKEVLADVKRAAHRTHEDPYVQGIIDVLEEHPEVASKLVTLSSVMPDVVEDILAQCPELVSDEIRDAIKAAKKRRASLFPELYTQKGTRRVRCAHDKVTV